MLNKDSQAETEVQDSTTADCTNVKPPYCQTPCYGQYGKVEDVCEINRVYHLNFLNNNLPDKCANLIIADPPYFEVKGAFDFVWEDMKAYLLDVEKWAKECKRLLADNGTLFWFGDAKKIAYSQVIFDEYFELVNNIAIEFNRQTKKGVENFNCFAPVSERLLMYDNGNQFTKVLNKRIAELKLREIDFRKLKKSKNGNETGWCSNILNGKNEPVKEDWELICSIIGDYHYTDLKRHFNNYKKLYDIMNFDQEAHITKNYDHDTCKPETLTRALIMTCSRPNDLVIVPFAGSGTEVAMSVKEGRRAIGFDIESKYVEMSNKRVLEILRKPELFR